MEHMHVDQLFFLSAKLIKFHLPAVISLLHVSLLNDFIV